MKRSLDDLRSTFPHLGFAVYAIEPGAPVTLEVHTADGQVFTTVRRTLDAAIERAFPSPPEPAPEVEPADAGVFG